MRAIAIFGIGCSEKNLKLFQSDKHVEWCVGESSGPHNADVVLVFGGDGTIHRHLSRLVELALPVLVVPAGSGNDFARALRLRRVRDSVAAWRRFCAGEDNIRSIDLGVISSGATNAGGSLAPYDTYFCSVAGVGLDAEVTRRANRLPRWLLGHGGYALMAASTIFRYAPLLMKISADENTGWIGRSQGPTMLAAFANSAIYGGGMKIGPRAKMDDGLLDVCVIGGMDSFKLACMFPTVYFGRHLELREVTYFRAGRCRVETEYPLDVYADGEFVCRTPVEISVETGVLRVITP